MCAHLELRAYALPTRSVTGGSYTTWGVIETSQHLHELCFSCLETSRTAAAAIRCTSSVWVGDTPSTRLGQTPPSIAIHTRVCTASTAAKSRHALARCTVLRKHAPGTFNTHILYVVRSCRSSQPHRIGDLEALQRVLAHRAVARDLSVAACPRGGLHVRSV